MSPTVVGRDDELAAIQAFLTEIEHGPRALVLSGEAGIGKTILWETGVGEARGSFGRVLTCRGVEAEASLSFTGLSELLGDLLEEVEASLAPPRRQALEVALLLAEPGETALDPHAIGLAVLDVLRALAEQGSVLVTLDDVGWIDPASAGAIQIALRRLRGEPLGLLATLRLGSELGSPFELDRSLATERLALGPLSIGSLRRMLEERLGLQLTRPELARVHEATAGNPFFALELGRELVRTGMRPAPGQALLVAALARPTVDLLAATYGDRDRVLDALEAATQEAVIELDDSQVRFEHPILGSICYERAPVWKRRAVHGALAGAVMDVEERARHLALAADGPDDAVATELDTAAEHAAARGAPGASARLYELAAELTPGGQAATRQRRLRAADHYRQTGEVDRAVALYNQLLGESPRGIERADALFGLVKSHKVDTPALSELYERALAEAADDDARSAHILAWRMGLHLYEADAQAALADAHAAVEKAERAADPFLLAVTIARASLAEAYAVEITPGMIERAVEIEERQGLEFETEESPRYALARLLMRSGEVDRCRELFDELGREAAERGDETSRVMVLWYASELEWLAGRWERARALGAAAYDLTEQTQYPRGRGSIGREKALLEADLGLVDEARASAQEGLAFTEQTGQRIYTLLTFGVLGRLELALGNLEAAGDHLRYLHRACSKAG
jgi:hypothetical protein